MAKKYEDFDYQDYVSKRQPQLDTLYNQYTNFDSVYDPSKDTGLQTAKNQLMSEANVLASKERGRMGNRIGARSSWTDAVSSSIQTDALKNYQNLIPQYMQNAKNDLLNQYNMLNQLEQQDYSRWADKRNFDYQNYANSITQENADRAYNYQVGRDKVADAQWQKQYDLSKSSAGSTTASSSSSVPSYVTNKLDMISSNAELEKYLDQLELSGVISQAQADALYATYMSGVSSGTASANSSGSSVDKIYGPLTLEEWKKKKNAK